MTRPIEETVCPYPIVENDFLGFPKVKWLQLTGEVGKFISV